MPDLDFLAKRMNDLSARLETESSRIAIEVGKGILRVLTRDTPVDTSQAISNWLVSIGSSTNEIIEAYSVGTKGSTYLSSSKTAYESGVRNIESKGTFEPIYIVNNLDYIESLEKGKSIQNSNFVFRAIVIGKEIAHNWELFGSNQNVIV